MNSIHKILIVIPPMKPNDFGYGYAHKVNYLLTPVEPLSLAAVLIQNEYDVQILDTGLYQKQMLAKTGETISDYQPHVFVLANQVENLVDDPENDGTPIGSSGIHEYWDNASDKQYSRELGYDNGVDFLKLTI